MSRPIPIIDGHNDTLTRVFQEDGGGVPGFLEGNGQVLRDRIPGLALRTTLITGFPGETDEDHAALLQFIEDVQFDALGVFKYSPEAGTMDTDASLHVPDEVKVEREREIIGSDSYDLLARPKVDLERRVSLPISILTCYGEVSDEWT